MKRNQFYLLIAGIIIVIIPSISILNHKNSIEQGRIEKFKKVRHDSLEIVVPYIGKPSKNINLSKLEDLSLIMKDLEESNGKFQPKLVDMQIELAKVFSPDNFDCIEGKLKEKIKKMQVKSKDGKDKTDGFIPKDVQEMVEDYPNSYMIGTGANYLAHSFTYLNTTTNLESKLLVAGDAPSYEDFTLDDYMIKGKQNIPYLIYTMDCSGYFSAAISASGGIGGNDIKTSASLTRNSESNLVVISCVMSSPLFSAYSGSKPLQKEDKVTYLRRIKILKSILKKLPSDNANLTINLKENYYVLLSSNSKTGSFNGSVNANANAGIGFGFGSASANADGNGKLSRTMNFDKFKTFILDNSIGSEFRPIPLKNFKDRIAELEKLTK